MAIEDVTNELNQELKAALHRATEAVKEELIRLIRSSPASGRTYRKGGRTYRASRPGKPPASQTGKLVSSITTSYKGVTGQVGINVFYGRFLEFGTKRIAPRPAAKLALRKKRSEIREMAKAAVDRAFGKVGIQIGN
jgi:HK97 gp10 family phage protein